MDIEVQATAGQGMEGVGLRVSIECMKESSQYVQGNSGVYLQEMLAGHETSFWQRSDIWSSGWSTARVSSLQAVVNGLSGW